LLGVKVMRMSNGTKLTARGGDGAQDVQRHPERNHVIDQTTVVLNEATLSKQRINPRYIPRYDPRIMMATYSAYLVSLLLGTAMRVGRAIASLVRQAGFIAL
jgi:hypothetical protein